ncbi:MAG TPA: NAD-dependent succinate-semialdehyde dehydrogenase [Alphaproteobacteria bacterium]
MASQTASKVRNETSSSDLMRTDLYIDGQWVRAKAGKTFEVKNPATGDLLAKVADAGIDDVNAAINSANAAFIPWKSALPETRAKIMQQWFQLILHHADTLADILTAEQGKPLGEAKAEIIYGASFVQWFAEEARRIYGRTIPPIRSDSRVLVTKQPIGVCAAITPWNFPNSMITRKVAPAIAAGCTVILKPAEATPLSALALAALAEQAGLPKGVLNMVTSTQSSEVGKALCESPVVRKLSFTGSTEVGRILMAQCAPTLKRLSMELGGNAPFIVFDDADLEKAVAGAVASKFRNAGQTCVCANRIYVQRGIYGAFTDKFKEAVAELKVGDGHAKEVMIGPLIDQKALKKVQNLVEDAKNKGAQVVLGGKTHELGGTFYQPTILTGVKAEMDLKDHEIFGPVAPLFAFDTEEEVIQAANSVEHGLAAYFYTNDLGRAFRVLEALEYGMVGVNEGMVSTAVAPFGGIKQSGFGREGAEEGIQEYLDVKYTLMGGLDIK